jgi:cytidylate kinase
MTNIITLDGPSSSGKGTIAKELSKNLNFFHLESGLLYRTLAKFLIDKGIDEDEIDAETIASLDLSCLIDTNKRRLVSNKKIYTSEVSLTTSKIATLKVVRDFILSFQRSLGVRYNLIADGRDMGTVVFTDAKLKIYVDAPLAIRAERRYNQLKDIEKNVNLAQVFNDLANRDQRDSSRTIAPLVVPLGAVIIDTSIMSVEQSVTRILLEYKKDS